MTNNVMSDGSSDKEDSNVDIYNNLYDWKANSLRKQSKHRQTAEIE